MPAPVVGVAILDFNHDGWMDLAFTHMGAPGLTLWRNDHGKTFETVELPKTDWVRAYGVAAFDYDNDGWVDIVAVGETKDGKGEVRLFRNLGPDGVIRVDLDLDVESVVPEEDALEFAALLAVSGELPLVGQSRLATVLERCDCHLAPAAGP